MNIIKRMLNFVCVLIKMIFSKICFIFKINNKKIVFDNFNGRGYGCNPKYIAEEIIKENLNYKMVWLVQNMNEEIPKQIKKVKYGSISALYELATAKIWIDNVRNYKGVPKKKNQFYIQTWHGTLGFKKVEEEAEAFLSANYVKDAKNDGKITDIMMTDNSIQENIFKNHYWYNGKVLVKGIPKNDILTNVPEGLKEKVYRYFNIDMDKKIVLYAPTFRNNANMNVYKFDYHYCCKVLSEKFGGQFVMLLRLHPNICQYDNLFEYDDMVLNASNYPDIQELVAVCNIGISDYSGVDFDVSRMGKPLFLICKDLNTYVKEERQFILELETLPFKVNITEKEMIEDIKMFSQEEYNIKCNDFFKKINLVSSDHASIDVVNIIKEKIGG